jgi:hypothetical protein
VPPHDGVGTLVLNMERACPTVAEIMHMSLQELSQGSLPFT